MFIEKAQVKYSGREWEVGVDWKKMFTVKIYFPFKFQTWVFLAFSVEKREDIQFPSCIDLMEFLTYVEAQSFQLLA